MRYLIINGHRNPAFVTVWLNMNRPGVERLCGGKKEMPPFTQVWIDTSLGAQWTPTVESIPEGVVTIHSEQEIDDFERKQAAPNN